MFPERDGAGKFLVKAKCLGSVSAFVLLLSVCTANAQVQDGLETQRWKMESWGNPVKLQSEPLENRGMVLKAVCEHGKQDKVIFSIQRPLNGLQRPFVVLDVRNDFDSEVGVAIAVQVGQRWTYFESSLRRPPRGAGFVRLYYDLSQPNFKCKKYEWIQGVPIEGYNRIRKFFLVLFPQNRGQMAGTMLFDRIQFVRGMFEVEESLATSIEKDEAYPTSSLNDFNNDGILDRLSVKPSVRIERGNADGSFTDVTAESGIGKNLTLAAWMDVDRDGNADLVALDAKHSIRILTGDGTGKFSDVSSDWSLPGKPLPENLQRLFAVDAEPDGDDDLFFQSEAGKWIEWKQFSTHGDRTKASVHVSLEGNFAGAVTVQLHDEKGKMVGARWLRVSKAKVPLPSTRATFYAPPGTYTLSGRLADGRVLNYTFPLEHPGQRVILTPHGAFHLYPKRVVTIDGQMGQGEWDGALTVQHTLKYVDFKTKEEEIHPMKVWLKADAYALYLCAKVEHDDFGNAREADMFHVFFDANGDGKAEHGEDVRAFWSTIYNDYHFFQRPNRLWTERDPFLDGEGVVTHTNPKGIGDYVYELMIPWDSHDPFDLAIDGDSEIGIKFMFTETKKYGNFWRWGSSLGRDGWPDSVYSDGASYARLKIRGLTRRPGKPTGKVTLSLTLPKPSRVVKGRVLDQDGQPIPEARVLLASSPSPSEEQRVETDQQGKYELPFEPVPPDAPMHNPENWIVVAASGFASAEKQIQKDELNCDIVLSRGLPLEGRVLDDKRKPLPGAEVRVGFGHRDWTAAETKTDEQGRFQFQHLPEGRLHITAYHWERNIWRETSVSAGQKDFVFDIRQPIRARGRVVDRNGKPVKTFQIRIGLSRKGIYQDKERWSPFYWISSSDELHAEDGSFDQRFGKQGDYKFRLAVIAPKMAPAVLEKDFFSGDDIKGLEVRMQPGRIVSGQVVEEATGQPVPHAKVQVTKKFEQVKGVKVREPDQAVLTDDKGLFRIETLSDASYRLFVSAPGFAPSLLDDVKGKKTAGQPIVIHLSKGAVVRGIFLKDGKPVSGRRLGIFQLDFAGKGGHGIPDAVTGPKGEFVFQNLGPGIFLLVDYQRLFAANRPRFSMIDAASLAKVTLKPGERVHLKSGTEASGASLHGTVTKNGKPAAGALVLLESNNGTQVERRWTAVTDAKGHYEIVNLPPGKYRIANVGNQLFKSFDQMKPLEIGEAQEKVTMDVEARE